MDSIGLTIYGKGKPRDKRRGTRGKVGGYEKTHSGRTEMGFGAEHRARTGDLNLGKVALYQLS